MKKYILIIFFFYLLIPGLHVSAKIDLVTLPDRDKVQLTIYNSADLTLIRESRNLTMRKGENKLQFSWANTLIDPTSLKLIPLKEANKIDVMDLTFPARIKDVGIWNINSQISGKLPIEITFFTSGISWKAYYLATLTKDEKEIDLEGYVRVTNNSGEDYENSEVRLIVGKIHILDQIAELARRYPPYGTPEKFRHEITEGFSGKEDAQEVLEFSFAVNKMEVAKQIVKEGLSEYFLYTIQGTETIPTGWTKRLPSFAKNNIPVVNLYKYEEERFGNSVTRFLSFKNDKEHNLGIEPLPDGLIKVSRKLDEAGHISYVGAADSKYIPIDEDVELNLGSARDIEVETKLMDYKTLNYLFNASGNNISGWDAEKEYEIKVSNYRPLPVKVEIIRNFPHQYWEISHKGDSGVYEKTDLDSVKFTLELEPNTDKIYTYKLTLHEGDRRQPR
jgi:hypothetical protein